MNEKEAGRGPFFKNWQSSENVFWEMNTFLQLLTVHSTNRESNLLTNLDPITATIILLVKAWVKLSLSLSSSK